MAVPGAVYGSPGLPAPQPQLAPQQTAMVQQLAQATGTAPQNALTALNANGWNMDNAARYIQVIGVCCVPVVTRLMRSSGGEAIRAASLIDKVQCTMSNYHS